MTSTPRLIARGLQALRFTIRDRDRVLVPIGFWSARFAEGGRLTIFTDHGQVRGTVVGEHLHAGEPAMARRISASRIG